MTILEFALDINPASITDAGSCLLGVVDLVDPLNALGCKHTLTALIPFCSTYRPT